MSTPVASASMSAPIGVISTAANSDGSESAGAVFDALFATIESLTGDGLNLAQTSAATNSSVLQPPSPQSVSEPQSSEANSANAPAPAGSGSWMAQIDANLESEKRLDVAAQTLPIDKLGDKTGKSELRGPVGPVRKIFGGEPNGATPFPADENIAAPKTDVGTSRSQKSPGASAPRSAGSNAQPAAPPQNVTDALLDQITEATPSGEQPKPNLVDPSQQPLAPPTKRSNEASPDQDATDKRDEPDVSGAGSLAVRTAQLESAAQPVVLPSNDGTHADSDPELSDADARPAAIETTSDQRGPQVAARAEVPKHVPPQTDQNPRDTLDGNTGQDGARPASLSASQITDASGQKAAPSTRSTTPAPVTDDSSAPFAKGDDAVRPQASGQPASSTRSTASPAVTDNSSAPLAKADDAIRPQAGGQQAPFHRADESVFTLPVETTPHGASGNVDAPVRVAFTTSPNSLEQPAFDALALRIAARSSEGDRNFSIRLDPPELGRVEVSLSVNSAGHAQAEITADKPQTLDLLQRDAPALERALKDAGLNLAGGFAFSLKGEGKSGGNWRDMQQGARGRALQIAAADASSASATLSGTAALAARAYGMPAEHLDIRV